jgi:hypothetical protein
MTIMFKIYILLLAQWRATLLELVDRKTTTSKNFTGFEIHQISSGHKLCSMKFEDTKDFLCWPSILLRYLQLNSCGWVAGWRFRCVSSLTGYRRMSAVCAQPWTSHICIYIYIYNMPTASYISPTKMEKYSLLTVQ